ncbi:putative senescence regulator S40 [Helianthus annuus]|nr:putative senescence regulator S40 [Helianthus annuus]
MAKGGRKLTISRSDRFLGSYHYATGNTHVEDDGVELGEDDVWSMVDDMVNDHDHHPISNDWSSRALVANSRHRRGSAGGLAVAFDDQPMKRIVHKSRVDSDSLASPRGRHVATSAPVNVPDWSKIYRVNSVESMHDSDEDHESDMVPPHEYLARTHKSSVFEGVGRTLKGRDMSRVRDAVWSQTGFDG